MTSSTPSFSLRRIWQSYRQSVFRHPWMVVVVTVGMLLTSVGEVLYQYVFKFLVDGLAAGEAVETVVQFVFILIGLSFCEYIVRRSTEMVNIYFQSGVKKDLADRSFRYLIGHSHQFFTDQFAGSLVKQTMRYVDSFENIADHLTFYFWPVLVQFSASIVLLWLVHPWFGILLLVWTILFIAIVVILNQWKMPLDIAESVAWSKNSGFIADVIANQSAVKAAGTEQREAQSYDGMTHVSRARERKSWLYGQLINCLQGLMMLAFEVVLLFLFLHLWEQKLLTAGDIVLLIGLVWYLFGRLWELSGVLRRFYGDAAYAMEMIELLNLPHSIQDASGAPVISIKKGSIELQNVTFQYKKSLQPIFTDFSLNINAGEKVALVGHSGGGKSTLVKLLQRLYDIQAGEIFIDSQNIAAVTQSSLRSQIALVPQDPALFHRTIAENIAYEAPKATLKEIKKAAKQAHADVFIDKLPQGYDTLVGERGVKLSGGERQRIAIARAILADCPILILDEATSSLDSQSEQFIQDALHTLMQNRTVLIIAHRLSTIKEADRILVLEDGTIVEEGTHQQLLRRKNGVYRGFYELQAGGFIGE